MTPVRSEQAVTRNSRALGQSMPQPIFMSNLNMTGAKPFGLTPQVNTFTGKEEKMRLHQSPKSAVSGLPRQLMGLNINLPEQMAKAQQRAVDARTAKRKSNIDARRGLGPSVSSKD